jgi:LmbE family N-acetylglucosaminyl deacetylase
MGAAVARSIERGGSGVFLSLSLGERGAPKSIPVARYAEMQRAAMEKAAALLGATAAFLPYPDGEIPFHEESALRVADAIREHKPDVIVTHWNGSWHKDHQNCHLLVHDAIFYAGLATLERKLPAHSAGKVYYAENWEDADKFQADVFLNVEAVYDKWMEACDLFPMWRGLTGFRYNDYYASLAVMRGCLANCRYAVALMSDPGQRVKRVETL